MNDKKLWPVFSIYIRLRDSDINGCCKCITCSNIRYYKDMDCGHGIPRQHMATKYHEQNNHAQCSQCNNFKRGNPVEYEKAVNKKYGPGTWEELKMLSRQPVKLSALEFNMMKLHFETEIERLKRGKNLR